MTPASSSRLRGPCRLARMPIRSRQAAASETGRRRPRSPPWRRPRSRSPALRHRHRRPHRSQRQDQRPFLHPYRRLSRRQRPPRLPRPPPPERRPPVRPAGPARRPAASPARVSCRVDRAVPAPTPGAWAGRKVWVRSPCWWVPGQRQRQAAWPSSCTWLRVGVSTASRHTRMLHRPEWEVLCCPRTASHPRESTSRTCHPMKPSCRDGCDLPSRQHAMMMSTGRGRRGKGLGTHGLLP